MLGRKLIGTAVLVYAAVLGCVVWPGSAPAEAPAQPDGTAAVANGGGRADPRSVLPIRGVAMQIQRVDWTDKYKHNIDEIADLGADAVSLVVDTRQENGSSSRIYLDMRITPSPEMLGAIIDHAKGRGLKVVLMPIVLLDNPRAEKNEWRGTIAPLEDNGGWDEWFKSYREMIGHFAWIAEKHKVDVLVIGSELVSTESKLSDWVKTINAVRSVYKGLITYSANWDHYTSIPFWNHLDLVATNSYYKLGEDHTVPVDEIVRRWQAIQKDLLAFVRKTGKPLLFTEVGWCSLQNAADAPWDYTQLQEPADPELQHKLYEGFFKAWYGNPDFGGFMIWEWTPGDGGLEDKGYTPENKPAGDLLREWMAKERWRVR
jgi:hypothetical protein